MTNKIGERLRLYNKLILSVRHIATDRSYKILNVTMENRNKHDRLMICDIAFWRRSDD